jgi:plasmid stability protein
MFQHLPKTPSRGHLPYRWRGWKSTNSPKILIEGRKVKRYLSATMPALVIKSFPEVLHNKLRQFAAAHRRSVTQETIHLIETAIAVEEKAASASNGRQPKWANRKLLPEYEALLNSGALNSDVDSTIGLSQERDAR